MAFTTPNLEDMAQLQGLLVGRFVFDTGKQEYANNSERHPPKINVNTDLTNVVANFAQAFTTNCTAFVQLTITNNSCPLNCITSNMAM